MRKPLRSVSPPLALRPSPRPRSPSPRPDRKSGKRLAACDDPIRSSNSISYSISSSAAAASSASRGAIANVIARLQRTRAVSAAMVGSADFPDAHVGTEREPREEHQSIHGKESAVMLWEERGRGYRSRTKKMGVIYRREIAKGEEAVRPAEKGSVRLTRIRFVMYRRLSWLACRDPLFIVLSW